MTGIDTAGWNRHEKLAAVLPSGRPVFVPAFGNSYPDMVLTSEARAAGYHDSTEDTA